jgi:AcrR family transcriptional regulator
VALVARGDLDFSIRDLARRLGVSHQAPYHHFPNRESLLAAIRDEGFDEFLATLRRARSAAADPERAIHALSYAYLDFARRRPHHYRLMFGDPAHNTPGDDSMPGSAAESFEELHGCVRDLQAMGRYPDRSSIDVAVSIWSWVHGLSLLHSQGRLRWLGYPDALDPRMFDRWAAFLPAPGARPDRATATRRSPRAKTTRRKGGLKTAARGTSSRTKAHVPRA